jgi:DNA-binding HxlR family transcriptional regulator
MTPPSVEYPLTPLGEELVPAINAIVEVARKLKATQSTPTGPSHVPRD